MFKRRMGKIYATSIKKRFGTLVEEVRGERRRGEGEEGRERRGGGEKGRRGGGRVGRNLE